MSYWNVTVLGFFLVIFGLLPISLKGYCGVFSDPSTQKG
jgi:hypothetical protein